MKIIEIAALENGAHRNQKCNLSFVPDGWAMIPEETAIQDLENFPFGDLTAEEVTYYRDIQVEKEVTKTREVTTYNEAGEAVTTIEEYTEIETVTEQEPYTVMTMTSWTPGTIPEVVEPEPEPTATEILNAMLGVE